MTFLKKFKHWLDVHPGFLAFIFAIPFGYLSIGGMFECSEFCFENQTSPYSFKSCEGCSGDNNICAEKVYEQYSKTYLVAQIIPMIAICLFFIVNYFLPETFPKRRTFIIFIIIILFLLMFISRELIYGTFSKYGLGHSATKCNFSDSDKDVTKSSPQKKNKIINKGFFGKIKDWWQSHGYIINIVSGIPWGFLFIASSPQYVNGVYEPYTRNLFTQQIILFVSVTSFLLLRKNVNFFKGESNRSRAIIYLFSLWIFLQILYIFVFKINVSVKK